MSAGNRARCNPCVLVRLGEPKCFLLMGINSFAKSCEAQEALGWINRCWLPFNCCCWVFGCLSAWQRPGWCGKESANSSSHADRLGGHLVGQGSDRWSVTEGLVHRGWLKLLKLLKVVGEGLGCIVVNDSLSVFILHRWPVEYLRCSLHFNLIKVLLLPVQLSFSVQVFLLSFDKCLLRQCLFQLFVLCSLKFKVPKLLCKSSLVSHFLCVFLELSLSRLLLVVLPFGFFNHLLNAVVSWQPARKEITTCKACRVLVNYLDFSYGSE